MRTFEEALPFITTGQAIGIDLTGLPLEETQRKVDAAYKEAAQVAFPEIRFLQRSYVVCSETLEENWPVDSGDFAAHGTGHCLEGTDPCTRVLVVLALPKLPEKVSLDISIGGKWNETSS